MKAKEIGPSDIDQATYRSAGRKSLQLSSEALDLIIWLLANDQTHFREASQQIAQEILRQLGVTLNQL